MNTINTNIGITMDNASLTLVVVSLMLKGFFKKFNEVIMAIVIPVRAITLLKKVCFLRSRNIPIR